MATPVSKKATAKVYLQVLGTATEDTTASLYLFADSQRYEPAREQSLKINDVLKE